MSGPSSDLPRQVRNDEVIFKILAWLLVAYIGAGTLLASRSFLEGAGSIAPTDHKGQAKGQTVGSEGLPVHHGLTPTTQVHDKTGR